MEKDIEMFIERCGMRDCSPISTPAAPGTKLVKPTVPVTNSTFDYRGVVGSLL
jgi:hypothetical protein